MCDEPSPPPDSKADAAMEPEGTLEPALDTPNKISVAPDIAHLKARIKGLQNMIRHTKSIDRLSSLRRDLATCRAHLKASSAE